MKHLYTLLLVVIFPAFQLFSQQLININPDPKGDPWYVGGLRKLSKEDTFKIENTPKLTLKNISTKKNLPSFVDNTSNKYFRPVFNQDGGSCGQASGVAYNFTYAINFARNLAANTSETQYPSHYTWNFLNGGIGNGSFYFDGWEIINANGCPSVQTYGGSLSQGGERRWMSGYENYLAGMQNRVLETFTINVSTPQGLEVLKSWMNDQLNNSSAGGLANFAAGVSGTFTMALLPAGTPEAYKNVVTRWDSEINHAMTFVGYNDSIRYDFNGDGKYTNNIDTNSDDIIDMRDWEIGGLIMVNSWGAGWGDDGKAYVMYRLLAEPSTSGGIMGGLLHVIRAKAEHTPLVTLKATIKHTSRNKLRITAGVSSNPLAETPDYTLDLPLFNHQGGNYYMTGGYTEDDKTIEIGIDISPLLSAIESIEEARFFLVIEEDDQSNTSTGEIISFSVFDYANGNVETTSTNTNVPIENNTSTYIHLNKSISFNKISIPEQTIPTVTAGFLFEHTLEANGGTAPYKWQWLMDFNQNTSTETFNPTNTEKLTPSDVDDGYAELILPFEFPFYGENYKTILVSTDGSVLFTGNFEYIRNESNLIGSKVITVYGSDLMLYGSDNDGIWHHSTKDSVTIHWKTSKYDNATFNADFYVTIYPSGIFKYTYGSGITSSNDWVSGVSNGDGVNYLKSTISGSQNISENTCLTYIPAENPEGFNLSENGKISFTTQKGNSQWSIKVRAIDQNKIFTTGNVILNSTESIVCTPDELTFQNPMDFDPFVTGKNITIHNTCTQNVVIDSIKTTGFCWIIDNYTSENPLTINPDEDINLTVKLKENSAKSANLITDSIKIYTPYTTYSIPVFVDPEVLSEISYTVNFNVLEGSEAVGDAIIEIERLTGSIKTNTAGNASIALPNGEYTFTITVPNKYQDTDNFTVNGSTKTINIQIDPSGTNQISANKYEIYPNPCRDEIKLLGINRKTKVTVNSILGYPIFSQIIENNNQTINTQMLGAGIYIITIDDEKGAIQSFKIIKL